MRTTSCGHACDGWMSTFNDLGSNMAKEIHLPVASGASERTGADRARAPGHPRLGQHHLGPIAAAAFRMAHGLPASTLGPPRRRDRRPRPGRHRHGRPLKPCLRCSTRYRCGTRCSWRVGRRATVMGRADSPAQAAGSTGTPAAGTCTSLHRRGRRGVATRPGRPAPGSGSVSAPTFTQPTLPAVKGQVSQRACSHLGARAEDPPAARSRHLGALAEDPPAARHRHLVPPGPSRLSIRGLHVNVTASSAGGWRPTVPPTGA
jgi:hypothetical protein